VKIPPEISPQIPPEISPQIPSEIPPAGVPTIIMSFK
jgi:hypothetical protein